MGVRSEETAGGVRIYIDGRFDFHIHLAFRDTLESVPSGSPCIVDLADTSYLDSSALGMLLLLKERADRVSIVNASDDVRKVLRIANFQRIFEVL